MLQIKTDSLVKPICCLYLVIIFLTVKTLLLELRYVHTIFGLLYSVIKFDLTCDEFVFEKQLDCKFLQNDMLN